MANSMMLSARLFMRAVSRAACERAMYSDSKDDADTQFCFLVAQCAEVHCQGSR
jgi:hypothetical protein